MDEYKAQVIKELKEDVNFTSSKFWSACHDAHLKPEDLKELLPRLIPMFLSDMVYADDDESLLDTEEDDTQPERDQVPGNDSFKMMNLRECSAKSIEFLSHVFGEEIFATLMPLIKEKLNSNDIPWKEKEAAIFALGVISEGCISFLYPILSEVVRMLLPISNDRCPLIRSKSCWTLSQFGMYFFKDNGPRNSLLFKQVLMCLLRNLLASNKRVQKVACLAFTTFEENAAPEDLVPYLVVIIQRLMYAFGMYQGNLTFLYNAIEKLLESVRRELNQPTYHTILMPPLTARLQELSNSDKELFPLLKCFASIFQALGVGFVPFAQPIVKKCVKIIQLQQLAKVDPLSSGVNYDKEFILCALDLLSRLADWVGRGIQTLDSQSNLKNMLIKCCMDEASDVALGAFVLMSDLEIVFPRDLQPRQLVLLEIASKELREEFCRGNRRAANNACKAIRELALKFREEVTAIVTYVVSLLCVILQHNEKLVEKNATTPVKYSEIALALNSAITLGILASIHPNLVALNMEQFMKPWCMTLSTLRDDTKKEDAFRGLCSVIKLNPLGGVNSVAYICAAIASWKRIINKDIQNEYSQVLNGYKHMLGGNLWAICLSDVDPLVKETLAKMYQV